MRPPVPILPEFGRCIWFKQCLGSPRGTNGLSRRSRTNAGRWRRGPTLLLLRLLGRFSPAASRWTFERDFLRSVAAQLGNEQPLVGTRLSVAATPLGRSVTSCIQSKDADARFCRHAPDPKFVFS